MNDWILLDVSGVLFKTTRATLTSDPDCVLTKMFEQNPRFQPPPLTVYGFYQIDACPRGFAVVLNWLRYRYLVLGREVEAMDVIPVARYFGLPDLERALLRGITDESEELVGLVRRLRNLLN